MKIVALSGASDVPVVARSRPAGVLVHPDGRVAAWLATLPADVPLHVVLPNMPEFLRDAGEHGFPGAALLRLRRARPAAWPAIGVAAVAHLADVARQDFRGIVPVLTALERAGLPSALRGLRSIALSSALTDLLLAAGHATAIAHWIAFVRRRCRVEAHLETNNLGHLLRRLAQWRITPDAVLGPLNSRGHRMKPDFTTTLTAVRESHIPVIATEVRASNTLPLPDAIAFALSNGAKAAIVDAADLASDE